MVLKEYFSENWKDSQRTKNMSPSFDFPTVPFGRFLSPLSLLRYTVAYDTFVTLQKDANAIEVVRFFEQQQHLQYFLE